ncbi:hypothetical protein WJX74_002027 [Apatococcus lobatus]|uniref:Uncharacterized protein n=1 Tax=Apatococcus lobatus TaxID=904363 RepID=A0AAW1QUC3_9CHLO
MTVARDTACESISGPALPLRLIEPLLKASTPDALLAGGLAPDIQVLAEAIAARTAAKVLSAQRHSRKPGSRRVMSCSLSKPLSSVLKHIQRKKGIHIEPCCLLPAACLQHHQFPEPPRIGKAAGEAEHLQSAFTVSITRASRRHPGCLMVMGDLKEHHIWLPIRPRAISKPAAQIDAPDADDGGDTLSKAAGFIKDCLYQLASSPHMLTINQVLGIWTREDDMDEGCQSPDRKEGKLAAGKDSATASGSDNGDPMCEHDEEGNANSSNRDDQSAADPEAGNFDIGDEDRQCHQLRCEVLVQQLAKPTVYRAFGRLQPMAPPIMELDKCSIWFPRSDCQSYDQLLSSLTRSPGSLAQAAVPALDSRTWKFQQLYPGSSSPDMDPSAIPSPGSVLSLISKTGVRYEGILYNINFAKSSVALHTVFNYGTEGRGEQEVPPSDRPFQYVDFPASDIQHLQVVKSPQEAQGSAWASSGPPGPQPPMQGTADPWSQTQQAPGQGWPSGHEGQQVSGMPPQQQQQQQQPQQLPPQLPQQQQQASSPFAAPTFPSQEQQAGGPQISFGSVMSGPLQPMPQAGVQLGTASAPPQPLVPAPKQMVASQAGSQPRPGVPTSAPNMAITPLPPAALNNWSVPAPGTAQQVQGQALATHAANSAQAAEAAAGVATAAAAAAAASSGMQDGMSGGRGGRMGRGPPHGRGMMGRGRGQGYRGRGRMPMNGDMHAARSQLRPIPKEDFDIQGALKSFNKDDLAQEAGQESPKKPAAAVVAASDGGGDDFFDSISCEAIERLELSESGQNPRPRLSEQRKVDMETFGGSGVPNRRGRGRGRGRGRRGGGRGPPQGRGSAPLVIRFVGPLRLQEEALSPHKGAGGARHAGLAGQKAPSARYLSGRLSSLLCQFVSTQPWQQSHNYSVRIGRPNPRSHLLSALEHTRQVSFVVKLLVCSCTLDQRLQLRRVTTSVAPSDQQPMPCPESGLRDRTVPDMGQGPSSEGRLLAGQTGSSGAYSNNKSGSTRGFEPSKPTLPATSSSAALHQNSAIARASRSYPNPPAICTRPTNNPTTHDPLTSIPSRSFAEELSAIRGTTCRSFADELSAIRGFTGRAPDVAAMAPEPLPSHIAQQPEPSLHDRCHAATFSLDGENMAENMEAPTHSAQPSTQLQPPEAERELQDPSLLWNGAAQRGSDPSLSKDGAAQRDRPGQGAVASESHASGGPGGEVAPRPMRRLQRTSSMLSQEVRSPTPPAKPATDQGMHPDLEPEHATESHEATTQQQLSRSDMPPSSVAQQASRRSLDRVQAGIVGASRKKPSRDEAADGAHGFKTGAGSIAAALASPTATPKMTDRRAVEIPVPIPVQGRPLRFGDAQLQPSSSSIRRTDDGKKQQKTMSLNAGLEPSSPSGSPQASPSRRKSDGSKEGGNQAAIAASSCSQHLSSATDSEEAASAADHLEAATAAGTELGVCQDNPICLDSDDEPATPISAQKHLESRERETPVEDGTHAHAALHEAASAAQKHAEPDISFSEQLAGNDAAVNKVHGNTTAATHDEQPISVQAEPGEAATQLDNLPPNAMQSCGGQVPGNQDSEKVTLRPAEAQGMQSDRGSTEQLQELPGVPTKDAPARPTRHFMGSSEIAQDGTSARPLPPSTKHAGVPAEGASAADGFNPELQRPGLMTDMQLLGSAAATSTRTHGCATRQAAAASHDILHSPGHIPSAVERQAGSASRNPSLGELQSEEQAEHESGNLQSTATVAVGSGSEVPNPEVRELIDLLKMLLACCRAGGPTRKRKSSRDWGAQEFAGLLRGLDENADQDVPVDYGHEHWGRLAELTELSMRSVTARAERGSVLNATEASMMARLKHCKTCGRPMLMHINKYASTGLSCSQCVLEKQKKGRPRSEQAPQDLSSVAAAIAVGLPVSSNAGMAGHASSSGPSGMTSGAAPQVESASHDGREREDAGNTPAQAATALQATEAPLEQPTRKPGLQTSKTLQPLQREQNGGIQDGFAKMPRLNSDLENSKDGPSLDTGIASSGADRHKLEHTAAEEATQPLASTSEPTQHQKADARRPPAEDLAANHDEVVAMDQEPDALACRGKEGATKSSDAVTTADMDEAWAEIVEEAPGSGNAAFRLQPDANIETQTSATAHNEPVSLTRAETQKAQVNGHRPEVQVRQEMRMDGSGSGINPSAMPHVHFVDEPVQPNANPGDGLTVPSLVQRLSSLFKVRSAEKQHKHGALSIRAGPQLPQKPMVSVGTEAVAHPQQEAQLVEGSGILSALNHRQASPVPAEDVQPVPAANDQEEAMRSPQRPANQTEQPLHALTERRGGLPAAAVAVEPMGSPQGPAAETMQVGPSLPADTGRVHGENEAANPEELVKRPQIAAAEGVQLGTSLQASQAELAQLRASALARMKPKLVASGQPAAASAAASTAPEAEGLPNSNQLIADTALPAANACQAHEPSSREPSSQPEVHVTAPQPAADVSTDVMADVTAGNEELLWRVLPEGTSSRCATIQMLMSHGRLNCQEWRAMPMDLQQLKTRVMSQKPSGIDSHPQSNSDTTVQQPDRKPDEGPATQGEGAEMSASPKASNNAADEALMEVHDISEQLNQHHQPFISMPAEVPPAPQTDAANPSIPNMRGAIVMPGHDPSFLSSELSQATRAGEPVMDQAGALCPARSPQQGHPGMLNVQDGVPEGSLPARSAPRSDTSEGKAQTASPDLPPGFGASRKQRKLHNLKPSTLGPSGEASDADLPSLDSESSLTAGPGRGIGASAAGEAEQPLLASNARPADASVTTEPGFMPGVSPAAHLPGLQDTLASEPQPDRLTGPKLPATVISSSAQGHLADHDSETPRPAGSVLASTPEAHASPHKSASIARASNIAALKPLPSEDIIPHEAGAQPQQKFLTAAKPPAAQVSDMFSTDGRDKFWHAGSSPADVAPDLTSALQAMHHAQAASPDGPAASERVSRLAGGLSGMSELGLVDKAPAAVPNLLSASEAFNALQPPERPSDQPMARSKQHRKLAIATLAEASPSALENRNEVEGRNAIMEAASSDDDGPEGSESELEDPGVCNRGTDGKAEDDLGMLLAAASTTEGVAGSIADPFSLMPITSTESQKPTVLTVARAESPTEPPPPGLDLDAVVREHHHLGPLAHVEDQGQQPGLVLGPVHDAGSVWQPSEYKESSPEVNAQLPLTHPAAGPEAAPAAALAAAQVASRPASGSGLGSRPAWASATATALQASEPVVSAASEPLPNLEPFDMVPDTPEKGQSEGDQAEQDQNVLNLGYNSAGSSPRASSRPPAKTSIRSPMGRKSKAQESSAKAPSVMACASQVVSDPEDPLEVPQEPLADATLPHVNDSAGVVHALAYDSRAQSGQAAASGRIPEETGTQSPAQQPTQQEPGSLQTGRAYSAQHLHQLMPSKRLAQDTPHAASIPGVAQDNAERHRMPASSSNAAVLTSNPSSHAGRMRPEPARPQPGHQSEPEPSNTHAARLHQQQQQPQDRQGRQVHGNDESELRAQRFPDGVGPGALVPYRAEEGVLSPPPRAHAHGRGSQSPQQQRLFAQQAPVYDPAMAATQARLAVQSANMTLRNVRLISLKRQHVMSLWSVDQQLQAAWRQHGDAGSVPNGILRGCFVRLRLTPESCLLRRVVEATYEAGEQVVYIEKEDEPIPVEFLSDSNVMEGEVQEWLEFLAEASDLKPPSLVQLWRMEQSLVLACRLARQPAMDPLQVIAAWQHVSARTGPQDADYIKLDFRKDLPLGAQLRAMADALGEKESASLPTKPPPPHPSSHQPRPDALASPVPGLTLTPQRQSAIPNNLPGPSPGLNPPLPQGTAPSPRPGQQDEGMREWQPPLPNSPPVSGFETRRPAPPPEPSATAIATQEQAGSPVRPPRPSRWDTMETPKGRQAARAPQPEAPPAAPDSPPLDLPLHVGSEHPPPMAPLSTEEAPAASPGMGASVGPRLQQEVRLPQPADPRVGSHHPATPLADGPSALLPRGAHQPALDPRQSRGVYQARQGSRSTSRSPPKGARRGVVKRSRWSRRGSASRSPGPKRRRRESDSRSGSPVRRHSRDQRTKAADVAPTGQTGDRLHAIPNQDRFNDRARDEASLERDTGHQGIHASKGNGASKRKTHPFPGEAREVSDLDTPLEDSPARLRNLQPISSRACLNKKRSRDEGTPDRSASEIASAEALQAAADESGRDAVRNKGATEGPKRSRVKGQGDGQTPQPRASRKQQKRGAQEDATADRGSSDRRQLIHQNAGWDGSRAQPSKTAIPAEPADRVKELSKIHREQARDTNTEHGLQQKLHDNRDSAEPTEANDRAHITNGGARERFEDSREVCQTPDDPASKTRKGGSRHRSDDSREPYQTPDDRSSKNMHEGSRRRSHDSQEPSQTPDDPASRRRHDSSRQMLHDSRELSQTPDDPAFSRRQEVSRHGSDGSRQPSCRPNADAAPEERQDRQVPRRRHRSQGSQEPSRGSEKNNEARRFEHAARASPGSVDLVAEPGASGLEEATPAAGPERVYGEPIEEPPTAGKASEERVQASLPPPKFSFGIPSRPPTNQGRLPVLPWETHDMGSEPILQVPPAGPTVAGAEPAAAPEASTQQAAPAAASAQDSKPPQADSRALGQRPGRGIIRPHRALAGDVEEMRKRRRTSSSSLAPSAASSRPSSGSQENANLASPGEAMVGHLAALLNAEDNDITAAVQAAMNEQAEEDIQAEDADITPSPDAADDQVAQDHELTPGVNQDLNGDMGVQSALLSGQSSQQRNLPSSEMIEAGKVTAEGSDLAAAVAILPEGPVADAPGLVSDAITDVGDAETAAAAAEAATPSAAGHASDVSGSEQTQRQTYPAAEGHKEPADIEAGTAEVTAPVGAGAPSAAGAATALQIASGAAAADAPAASVAAQQAALGSVAAALPADGAGAEAAAAASTPADAQQAACAAAFGAVAQAAPAEASGDYKAWAAHWEATHNPYNPQSVPAGCEAWYQHWRNDYMQRQQLVVQQQQWAAYASWYAQAGAQAAAYTSYAQMAASGAASAYAQQYPGYSQVYPYQASTAYPAAGPCPPAAWPVHQAAALPGAYPALAAAPAAAYPAPAAAAAPASWTAGSLQAPQPTTVIEEVAAAAAAANCALPATSEAAPADKSGGGDGAGAAEVQVSQPLAISSWPAVDSGGGSAQPASINKSTGLEPSAPGHDTAEPVRASLGDPVVAGMPVAEPEPLNLDIPGLTQAAAAVAADPAPNTAVAPQRSHQAPAQPAAVLASAKAQVLHQKGAQGDSPRLSIPGLTQDAQAVEPEAYAAPQSNSTSEGLATTDVAHHDIPSRSARPRSGGSLLRRSRISKLLSPEHRPGIAAAVAAADPDRSSTDAVEAGRRAKPGTEPATDESAMEGGSAWGLSAQQRQRIAMRHRQRRPELPLTEAGQPSNETLAETLELAALPHGQALHAGHESMGPGGGLQDDDTLPVIGIPEDDADRLAPPGVDQGPPPAQPSPNTVDRVVGEDTPGASLEDARGRSVHQFQPEHEVASHRAGDSNPRPLSASEQTDIFLNSLASEPVTAQPEYIQTGAPAVATEEAADIDDLPQSDEAPGVEDAWPTFEGSQDTEGPMLDVVRSGTATRIAWGSDAGHRNQDPLDPRQHNLPGTRAASSTLQMERAPPAADPRRVSHLRHGMHVPATTPCPADDTLVSQSSVPLGFMPGSDPRRGASLPMAASVTATGPLPSHAATVMDLRSAADPRRRFLGATLILGAHNVLQASTAAPTLSPRMDAAGVAAPGSAGIEQAAPPHHPQIGHEQAAPPHHRQLDPRRRALASAGTASIIDPSPPTQAAPVMDPRLRHKVPLVSSMSLEAAQTGQAASPLDPRVSAASLNASGATEPEQVAPALLPQGSDQPVRRNINGQADAAGEWRGDPRKRHRADMEDPGAQQSRGRSSSYGSRHRSQSPGSSQHWPSKRPHRGERPFSGARRHDQRRKSATPSEAEGGASYRAADLRDRARSCSRERRPTSSKGRSRTVSPSRSRRSRRTPSPAQSGHRTLSPSRARRSLRTPSPTQGSHRHRSTADEQEAQDSDAGRSRARAASGARPPGAFGSEARMPVEPVLRSPVDLNDAEAASAFSCLQVAAQEALKAAAEEGLFVRQLDGLSLDYMSKQTTSVQAKAAHRLIESLRTSKRGMSGNPSAFLTSLVKEYRGGQQSSFTRTHW